MSDFPKKEHFLPPDTDTYVENMHQGIKKDDDQIS